MGNKGFLPPTNLKAETWKSVEIFHARVSVADTFKLKLYIDMWHHRHLVIVYLNIV